MAFTLITINFKFEIDPYIVMSNIAYYLHAAKSESDRVENAGPLIRYEISVIQLPTAPLRLTSRKTKIK
jgi:hypothetical protein